MVAQSYCGRSKVFDPICYYKAVKGSQILLIRHFTETTRDDKTYSPNHGSKTSLEITWLGLVCHVGVSIYHYPIYICCSVHILGLSTQETLKCIVYSKIIIEYIYPWIILFYYLFRPCAISLSTPLPDSPEQAITKAVWSFKITSLFFDIYNQEIAQ